MIEVEKRRDQAKFEKKGSRTERLRFNILLRLRITYITFVDFFVFFFFFFLDH